MQAISITSHLRRKLLVVSGRMLRVRYLISLVASLLVGLLIGLETRPNMLFEASNMWGYAFAWCGGAMAFITVVEGILGTGLTSGNLKQYRRYNGLVYIVVPVLVYTVGFLFAW